MADDPNENGPKTDRDPVTGRILPGAVLNPTGRPKGSRTKLGEDFVAALQEDFRDNGVQVIRDVRADKPEVYLKIIASLLPKTVELDPGVLGALSDDQVTRFVEAIDRWLAANPDEGAGASVLSSVQETAGIPRGGGRPH